jgi:uncharacterized OB-fold protein
MLRGMPLPRPDHDTQGFWDAAQEGRFVIPRCASCSKGHWPPGPMCPHCKSQDLQWSDFTGQGTVYSWVVATHPVDEILVDQVPYAIALIDLEESVRVVGNVVGCDPYEIEAGMAVELFFEEREEGVRVPNFRVPGA